MARAASGWLRREQAPGTPFRRPGPGHRDLLAGLMAGLGESLAMDQATLAIATYALALLEHEEAAAMDTPGRMAGSDPLTPDYLAGLLIAKRLWAALGDEGNDVPAE